MSSQCSLTEAAERAHALLKGNALSPKMPLMGFYVYTPKYVSFTTIATLSPAPTSKTDKIELSS
jgi:hypothetical protein